MLAGAAAAIAQCNRLGIPVVLVSNQSGIARGLYDWKGFAAVQAALADALTPAGARLDGVFACAHHADGQAPFDIADHPWRKPNPGMIVAAGERHEARSCAVMDRRRSGVGYRGRRAARLAGGVLISARDDDPELQPAAALASKQFAVDITASLADAVALLWRAGSLALAKSPITAARSVGLHQQHEHHRDRNSRCVDHRAETIRRRARFLPGNVQARSLRRVRHRRPFVQDNLSRSARGALRGLHFQNPNPQGKLVTVLRGAVRDVVVDVRVGSPTFGRHVAVDLDRGEPPPAMGAARLRPRLRRALGQRRCLLQVRRGLQPGGRDCGALGRSGARHRVGRRCAAVVAARRRRPSLAQLARLLPRFETA